jgi:transposase
MNANQERSEDLAWMAGWHTTPREAARRLGISLDSLNRWCARNDPEVLERLRLNEARRKLGRAS